MTLLNKLIAGASLGAALMYLFDPQNGRQRRRRIRAVSRSASENVRKVANGSVNIASGARNVIQSLRREAGNEEVVNDKAVAERVHAAIEYAVDHPGAIEVSVLDGDVTLSGAVFKDQLPLLVDCIYDIPGVRSISNRLIAHGTSDRAPALLQSGKAARHGARPSLLHHKWSTPMRAAVGTLGAAGAIYAFMRPDWLGRAAGVGGLALITRAATNMDFVRLLGLRRDHYSIAIKKTLDINAPIEHVFALWSDPSNFPRFMTHVVDVRALEPTDRGVRRWHWKLHGSSGLEFEFTSDLTALEPNELIAWRSEPGALAEHAGYVRFIPLTQYATRVDVRLAYTPVAGAIGHVIAKLLGDDPKKQMDDDLQRMKDFIETGVPPRDAAVNVAQPGGPAPVLQ
jgi:uncharacterized membrane protein